MSTSTAKVFGARQLAVVLLLCTTSSITFAHGDVLLSSPFILGSTRYSAADFVDCFAARIGQPVSRALLDAITADIQARYRRDGLVVPAVVALDSELGSTTPRIHVFESSIEAITLRGDAGPYADTIMAHASELRGGAIDKRRMQAYLRSLNELPGLDVRARFEPRATGGRSSAPAPGRSRTPVTAALGLLPIAALGLLSGGRSSAPAPAALGLLSGAYQLTLVLDARYDAIDGAVSVSNRGTSELGRTIVAGRVTFNGMLGSESAASLSGATSNEPNRYRYVGAGVQRNVAGIQARVDVADTRAKLGYGYEYHAQRARLELRTTALHAESLRIEPLVGFVVRDAEGAYPDERVSDVSTRTVELGVVARGSGERTSALVRMAFSRGLDAVGASAFTRSGLTPELDYWKSSLDLAVVHAFDSDWLMRLDAEGQWSTADLPANERFAFGGSVFGRAFDPGELIGDRGGALSVQIERKLRTGAEFLRRSSLYLQSDYGYARDDAFGEDDAASITAGFKAAFASLVASLELSTPLDRSDENPRAKDPRAFAQMQIRF